MHTRFTRWAKAGVWERVFDGSDRGSRQPVSDARHHPGPRPPAGGDRKRGDRNQALGRSRGGLTTKIHMLADTLGRPLRFILTAGQAPRHHRSAEALLEGVDRQRTSSPTRPMTATTLRQTHRRPSAAEAVIPSPSHPQDPDPGYDKTLYKQRNRIERCFNKLKHFRRFATRYDRRAAHFLAFGGCEVRFRTDRHPLK